MEGIVNKLLVLFAVVGLLAASSPVSAHHGTAGYEMDKVITVKGTVSSYSWANPHVVIHFAVKNDKGESQDWVVELAAPSMLARGGWTKNSMKPGDSVVFETHPSKNGVTTGLSGTANGLLKFVVNGQPLPYF
jgi:uncharacterized protein DUF6152